MNKRNDLDLLVSLEKIMKNHKGVDNSITNSELAEQLGVSKVKAREIYSQAVRHGGLYGSHPNKGFFFITSKDELELSSRQLRSRIKRLSERLCALERNYEMSFLEPADLY